MKSAKFMILVFILSFSAGCAHSIDYRELYPFGKDTIVGYSDLDRVTVWRTAWEVFVKEGKVMVAREASGAIQAEIGGAQVYFEAEQVTAESVRYLIRSRKLKKIFPELDIAHDLFRKIENALDKKTNV